MNNKEFLQNKTAAESGDADAQNELGCCYQHGYGVPQNRMTALYWFEKAANHGHEEAQTVFKGDLFFEKG